MQSLDIPLLRTFRAIARTGSISAAAAQVGRTQSAISMQVKRLEGVVGQALLYRTGSGVTLTSAGDRLLTHAEAILSRHDEALTQLCGPSLGGTVSFGCPEDYLTAFFPPLLAQFAGDHPGIDLEIVCAPTVDLQRLLKRRRIDLALVSVPVDAPGVIRKARFVWAAADPQPAFLSDPKLPLALSAPETMDHRAALAALQQAGRAYRLAFASNSLAALLSIARSGQAVSVVTEAAMPPDLHDLTEWLPPLPDIGMRVTYAGDRPAPSVRAFGGFIADRLGRP